MAFQGMMASPLEKVAQAVHQELTVEQSLELVKIFLNSSLACICYMRELLRWTSNSLQIRYIEQVSISSDDTNDIYTKFLEAERPTPPSSQQVRILVRSQDHRANCILDMLKEHGVFDAIKSTYLDTLQVFVATDSTDSRTVLETYTYQFEYNQRGVASVHVGETDQSFTLLRSQKSFKAAIRGLLRAMQEMSRLPKKCVLGMSMSYKNGCPNDYEPEGFIDGSCHGAEDADWDALWDPPSGFTASFETTHYNVKIAAKPQRSLDPTISQLQDTAMSKELQNMQKTSSSRNHALQSTVDATRSPGPKRKQIVDEEGTRRAAKRSKASRDEISIETQGVGGPVQPEKATEDEAVDEDARVATSESQSVNRSRPMPRRRKKSISKILVPVCDSTPVSQRYFDEIASEADATGITPSGRASSAASDV